MKKVTLSYLIKGIAGKTVVLVNVPDGHAVLGGVLKNDLLLIFNGGITAPVVVPGKPHIAVDDRFRVRKHDSGSPPGVRPSCPVCLPGQ